MIVYRGKKHSKFHNEPVFIGKLRFASKKEAARYRELAMAEKQGLIHQLEVHPIIPLEVMGIVVCRFIPDFKYIGDDGSVRIEDTKGYRVGPAYQIFRLKCNLLEALHGIKVREI